MKSKGKPPARLVRNLLWSDVHLRVFALHPGITPLGNDPEWFQITRFYLEMCLHGVNTQWVYSQGVIQKPSEYKPQCEGRAAAACALCPVLSWHVSGGSQFGEASRAHYMRLG